MAPVALHQRQNSTGSTVKLKATLKHCGENVYTH